MRRLTERQVRVLQCLYGRGWLPSWRTSSWADVNNGVLRQMVKRGLVRKTLQPEGYHRKKVLHFHITKKGEKAWEAIEKPLKVVRMLDKIQLYMETGKTRGPTLHW